MPVRDDADHLPAAVRAVLAQDYPGDVELVVAVGPSQDPSAQVAAELAATDPRVRVVDNPDGSTPSALNRAIAASSGEVVARVDAHSELSVGYLRAAVETLERTGAANVGGVQRAVGTAPMQRAIAAAMSSRFGTGDARFHYGGEPGPVDTVYLGVFRRSSLDAVGGFDETLVRNQDYELNHRLREAGGTVWFDPGLEVTYRPRSSLTELASQYWQYGRWKRLVVRRHPRSLRWRQLVPPAAVIANAAGLLVATRDRRGLYVPAAYLVATAVAAWRGGSDLGTRARLLAVFPTMHHAWGAGFLVGVRPRRRPGGGGGPGRGRD